MADPVSVASTLIGLIPIAFGALIPIGIKPIDELIRRAFARRDEDRKEEKERKKQREGALRDLFVRVELFKNESHDVFEIFNKVLDNPVIDMEGNVLGSSYEIDSDSALMLKGYKKYDFTGIESVLYIDSPKLSVLWMELCSIRSKLLVIIFSEKPQENKLEFGRLVFQFDSKIEGILRMIAYVINGEKTDKFSHLLQPPQDLE